MAVTKQILCLANSKKMSERCVAGRDMTGGLPGPWIRPVSDRPTEELNADERQYADGSEPHVLEAFELRLEAPHPHACQTENWTIDPQFTWVRRREIGWLELQSYIERPATLWINDYHTRPGYNDEIPRVLADKLDSSLCLIRVPELELRVFAPGADFGDPKRRVQARFSYRDVSYWLWVTDALVEREYLHKDDGRYFLGESCLCVSLGEPFANKGQEFRYKIVAAVIQKAVVLP